MADLTAAAPRIAKLMLVALSPAATENERATAFDLLRQAVGEVDPGGHELAERIRSTPVSDEDIQRVFDTGREEGRDEVLRRTPASSPTGGGTGNYVGDRDRVNGDDTYNGFPLRDIAQHCANNLSRISEKHRGFIEDMNDRLMSFGSTVSGAQARYLVSLFKQYFSGRM